MIGTTLRSPKHRCSKDCKFRSITNCELLSALQTSQYVREVILDLVEGMLYSEIAPSILQLDGVPIGFDKRFLGRTPMFTCSVLSELPKSSLLSRGSDSFQPSGKITVGNDMLALMLHWRYRAEPGARISRLPSLSTVPRKKLFGIDHRCGATHA